MALTPATAPRKLSHTRSITCHGFEREDGLWDIEAHMQDVKAYAFTSEERGEVLPGTPVHSMWLRLTVDGNLTVQAVEAVTEYSPFPSTCPHIASAYQQIVGLTIGPGWTRKIKELLGGVRGCTHLSELLGPVATTAFQTIVPKRNKTGMRQKALVNTCHAFRADGPLMKDVAKDD